MWSILRAKGGKTSLIKGRQRSTLIFSANVNEAEGPAHCFCWQFEWCPLSRGEASWISPSPFLGSCGGDFPTQPNRNSFIWDLSHSSSLIFRSASCSLMQSWQNLLAASVKTGCLNLLDQKYRAFKHRLPVRFQELHQILRIAEDNIITSAWETRSGNQRLFN